MTTAEKATCMDDGATAREQSAPIGAANANLGWIALMFVLAIIPFAATPIVPTIDFYNHVARYFVLSRIDGDGFLQRYYASNWSLLPNIGMDVLGVGVLRALPALAAAKLLLILILLVQYSGILFFSRQVTGRYSLRVALLTLPLLYSYIFFWGFANFLLGLGLAFWAAGWWMRMRDRLPVALPVACIAAIAIFLTHGLAFALYGMLLGMIELGLFLERPQRRLVDLVKAAAPLVVQAIIPVLLFRMATTSKSADGLTNADESVRRLMDSGRLARRLGELVVYRLQTIIRVAEAPALWFDVLTFLATIAILAMLCIRGVVTIPRRMWPAILLGLTLVVVIPPAMFGVGYVADRMPLFLALILVGSLSFRPTNGRLERACMVVLAVMVAARIGFIGVDWSRYRSEMEQFQTVAKAMPPQSLVSGFDVQLGRDDSVDTRCAMYPPLLALLDGHATPLFAYATQQPLTLVGPLAAAVERMPKSIGQTDAPAYYASYIAAAQAQGQFRYLLICNADRLKTPYPPGTRVAATAGRFTLLELHPATRGKDS
jgi:hypothetical protein